MRSLADLYIAELQELELQELELQELVGVERQLAECGCAIVRL
jgi:hypothetical protein